MLPIRVLPEKLKVGDRIQVNGFWHGIVYIKREDFETSITVEDGRIFQLSNKEKFQIRIKGLLS